MYDSNSNPWVPIAFWALVIISIELTDFHLDLEQAVN